jgi:sRNA-binding carbon storage regulator CsrA
MGVDMKGERDMPRGGGLQINRKLGQSVFIYVNGVEIEIQLRHVQPGSAKIGIIADPTKVSIRRGEQVAWKEK